MFLIGFLRLVIAVLFIILCVYFSAYFCFFENGFVVIALKR